MKFHLQVSFVSYAFAIACFVAFTSFGITDTAPEIHTLDYTAVNKEWKPTEDPNAPRKNPEQELRLILKKLNSRYNETSTWHPISECRFAIERSALLWEIGDHQEAKNTLKQTLDALPDPQANDPLLLAYYQYVNAEHHYFLGKHKQALELYLAAYDGIFKYGTEHDRLTLTNSILFQTKLLNETDIMVSYGKKIKAQFSKETHPSIIAIIDQYLGSIDTPDFLEKYNRIENLFEAFEYFKSINSTRRMNMTLEILISQNILPPEELLVTSEDLLRTAKSFRLKTEILQSRAATLAMTGNPHKALEAHNQAVEIAQDFGDPAILLKCNVLWADFIIRTPGFRKELVQDAVNRLQQGFLEAEQLEDTSIKMLTALALASWNSQNEAFEKSLHYLELASHSNQFESDMEFRQRWIRAASKTLLKLGRFKELSQYLIEEKVLAENIRRNQTVNLNIGVGISFAEALDAVQIKYLESNTTLSELRTSAREKEIQTLESIQQNDKQYHYWFFLYFTLLSLMLVSIVLFLIYNRREQTRIQTLQNQLSEKNSLLQTAVQETQEQSYRLGLQNQFLKVIDDNRKEILGITVHQIKEPINSLKTSVRNVENYINIEPIKAAEVDEDIQNAISISEQLLTLSQDIINDHLKDVSQNP